MAYRLEAGETIGSGIQRIAYEQVARAMDELDDEGLDDHETVHQVRKRCKKIRGLLRLARPAFGDAYSGYNRAFRDAARRLSPVRDAEAVLETFDELVDVYDEVIDKERFEPVRSRFKQQKTEVAEEVLLEDRLAEFRVFCEEQQDEISNWDVEGAKVADVADGLKRTYARGRDEFEEAFDACTTSAFHEWRKRVKYHWYHMRILRDVWPPVVRARRDELDQLSDILGDEHDLAVLKAKIADDPYEFAGLRTVQALYGLIEQRRSELQARSWYLGTLVYAEQPGSLAERFSTYLDIWQRQAELRPQLS